MSENKLLRIDIEETEPAPQPTPQEKRCWRTCYVTNENPRRVWAMMTTVFWQTGPGCTNEEQKKTERIELDALERRLLGCAHYHDSGSMCADHRRWEFTDPRTV